MQTYKIILKTDEENPVVLCETKNCVYIASSKGKVLKLLKKANLFGLFFSHGDNSLNLNDCFRVIIKINCSLQFGFIFSKDEIDLISLRNDMYSLKESNYSDEDKIKKVYKMLKIIFKYNPILGYCNSYVSELLDFKMPINFFFIMRASPTDKEEIDYKNKEDKKSDCIISCLAPCIVFITFFALFEMQKKELLFYLLLAVCLIVDCISFVFYTTGRNKEIRSRSIFLEKKYWCLYNGIGVVVGLSVSFLLSKFLFNSTDISVTFKHLGLCTLYCVLFLLISYTLSYFLFLFLSKKTLDKNASVNEKKNNLENKD